MTTPHLTVTPDRRLIRAGGRSERFLLVDVVAPTATRDPGRRRPPVNLSFVVDRSGSMAGHGKLGLVKQAVVDALARLEPSDRFSVVAYDDRVDIVAPSAEASGAARATASAQLARIDSRGSTNLGDGWLTGAGQVGEHLVPDGVNRVLLLTDGLANVGMTSPEELAQHAGELRARGVSTTTFGVGEDFDEALLQAMSMAGGGQFYFMSDGAQIADYMTSEVGEALEVVARDVVLEVTAPESVQVTSLSPYKVEPRGSRTLVHLGDLVSGQVVRLVLRLTFPYGEVGREIGALVAVNDRDDAFRTADPALAPVALAWSWADHEANDRQPRVGEVDRAVAEVFAARARQEAVRRNRAGDFAGAQRALQGVARRVREYAGNDPRLQEVVAGLEGEATITAAPMMEMDRKQMHYASSNVMRSRDATGKANRRPS